MMSRRNTFPSLSSSRQMMMAWNVSGLSHRPAIIASRPASMRLAMAILALARQQLHRAHLTQIHATGSSVRSVGSLASDLAGTFCWTSTSSPPSLSGSSSASSRCSSPSSVASSVSTTLTPISLNMARMSSICSELTSSEGRTELIWSWVT
jgi:hypothetical protein